MPSRHCTPLNISTISPLTTQVHSMYSPSVPEFPPFSIGTPPGRSPAMPRCTLSTLPTLLSLPAAIPGTSVKSTPMNRSIMSFVTCGTSKPAIWDASSSLPVSLLHVYRR